MWQVSLLFVLLGVVNSAINIGSVKDDPIRIYSTVKEIAEFSLKTSSFGASKDPSAIVATINANVKHQTIIGFGGTFSDATGLNLNNVTADVRKQVLEALFGDEGIGMNLCRVTIGATEFSTRLYTLDDHSGDTSLKQFALQDEDIKDKIPAIKDAQALRKDLKVFASASTAPLWMKDHKIWVGYSMLSEQHGKVYAEYLEKVLDEYQKQGVSWWGISTGNNPSSGFRKKEPNSMGWVPDLQSAWIREHFGPILRNSSHKGIKIIGHDDTPLTLPYFAPVYIEDKETLEYVDGLATHWNLGQGLHPAITDFTKSAKKDLFLLGTETSYGNVNPILGNWNKAFKILGEIYTLLQWNYVGWVDSNLVLNSAGGPSYTGTFSDAPIILSKDHKSFTKTPAYFILGHFSKFVTPGSVRIEVGVPPTRQAIQTVAFLRPDNVKVLSIYNPNAANIKLQLNDGDKYSQPIVISGLSVNTVLY